MGLGPQAKATAVGVVHLGRLVFWGVLEVTWRAIGARVQRLEVAAGERSRAAEAAADRVTGMAE